MAAIASISSVNLMAQGIRDIRINEILVKNVDSYADDHANHVGWIELFNSGYSQADISGTCLRLKQGDKVTTYRIPKNDGRTKIDPQGYVIFFADGSSNKGTFHTNFLLNESDSSVLASLVGVNDTLEFLDQSGANVIDYMVYDLNEQVVDQSYGRLTNDEGEVVVMSLPSITPMQTNEVRESVPKSEQFRQNDENGFIMAIIAMSVVFSALLCLFLIFKTLGKIMTGGLKRKKEVKKTSVVSALVDDDEDMMNGEEIAAIAMALKKYTEDLHDMESDVITINKVARSYSPWSSKIYGMRQLPTRK